MHTVSRQNLDFPIYMPRILDTEVRSELRDLAVDCKRTISTDPSSIWRLMYLFSFIFINFPRSTYPAFRLSSNRSFNFVNYFKVRSNTTATNFLAPLQLVQPCMCSTAFFCPRPDPTESRRNSSWKVLISDRTYNSANLGSPSFRLYIRLHMLLCLRLVFLNACSLLFHSVYCVQICDMYY